MTVSALPWWICTKCIYYHHPFLTFVWIYLISFEIKCDPDIELVNLALFTNFVPIGNWSCKCPRFYVRHFDCLIRGQKILRKWGLTSEKLYVLSFTMHCISVGWIVWKVTEIRAGEQKACAIGPHGEWSEKEKWAAVLWMKMPCQCQSSQAALLHW